MRIVHSFVVLFYSKHAHTVVSCAVSFGAFKTFNCIVESRVGWVKLKRFVRNDLGALPTAIGVVVVAFEHVVSGYASERVLVVGTWFGL